MNLSDSRRLSQLLTKRIEQYGYKNALKYQNKANDLSQSFYRASSRCSSKSSNGRSSSVAEINEKLKKKYQLALQRSRSQQNSDELYLSKILGSSRVSNHSIKYTSQNGVINGQFMG